MGRLRTRIINAPPMGSDPFDDATVMRPETPAPRYTADDARFTPGTIVAGRYRIVSLLGEGGMGEVYRADDIRLGQRVALKYVPARLAHDAGALDRLLHEVRIGRTISHPNVCRLYDLVETDGYRFIAMEYVDGENLASLLRRIGRLPAAKAVAIACDICGGLVAAHDRGVIHRDLKPANIMIDGRGTARITDFGLAALADETTGAARPDAAGTPAYMAPEQLAGGGATIRSDIYGLGLVLYETFTGKRLFDAQTMDELRRQHVTAKTRPSTLAADIDPAVERLILRCVEEDPALRPPSMHAVVAALPGGDRLQAAIAAGETPSPAMVAAAGEVGDISSRFGWMMIAISVAAVVAAAWFSDHSTILGSMNGLRARDVLADRAHSIIRSLGYATGSDHASWWVTDSDYLEWIAAHDKTRSRWDALASAPPSPLEVGYRERDGELVTASRYQPVTADDPAPTQTGDTSVLVDHEGRLIEFTRVPPPIVPAHGDADWHAAFVAAGLDERRFHAVEPQRIPPIGADRRYAWSGTYAEAPQIPLRVEAASCGGKPVFFRVLPPWTRPRDPAASTIGNKTFAILVFAGWVAGAVIARRNATRGRVDIRGAWRIGVAATTLALAGYAVLAHHVTEPYAEYLVAMILVGIALYSGLYAAVVYCACEPYVRRRWPRVLVGWSRLAAGRIRDPLVGREVLIGIAAGAVTLAVTRAFAWLSVLNGTLIPRNPLTNNLASASAPAIFYVGNEGVLAANYTMGMLILLLLLRLMLRNTAAALAVTVVLYGLMQIRTGGIIDFVAGAIAGAVLMLLLFRYGAVSHAAARFVLSLAFAPLTLRWSEPYASITIAAIAPTLLLAAAAFHIALAGKPLFGAAVAEDATAAS